MHRPTIHLPKVLRNLRRTLGATLIVVILLLSDIALELFAPTVQSWLQSLVGENRYPTVLMILFITIVLCAIVIDVYERLTSQEDALSSSSSDSMNASNSGRATPGQGSVSQSVMLRLRELLKRCDEFRSDITLRALFQSDSLQPWAGGLQDASSPNERATLTVAYLSNQRHANGTSALVLLLQTLLASYSSQDDRHKELVEVLKLLGV